MNKFWGGDGSSSSSSSSSSDSEDDRPEKKVETAVRRPVRWAEESSSDEEDNKPRVVRSHTDKRYAQLMEKIGVLKNHQKIEDFSSLISDYEGMIKVLDKLKNIVEQDGGPPKQFIKSIANLETRLDELHAEFLEKKQNKGEKLSESKQRAFNTLRAKVRKGNKNFQQHLDKFREDPDEFESDQEPDDQDSDNESDSPRRGKSASSSDSSSHGDSDSDSSSSSSSDSGSDSSDSDSDSSSSSGGSSSSSSNSDSNAEKSWKSATDDTDDEGQKDDDAAREKKMLRWVITPEKHAKREKKKQLDDQQKKGGEPKGKEPKVKQKKKEGRHEDKKKVAEEPEEYTAEELMKKVTEIAQQRGRRAFDKKAYNEKLTQLYEHAVKHGPRAQLYIYSSMVSADFDNTGSAFAAMKIDMWNEALDKVIKMLPLLIESYNDTKSDEKVASSEEELGEWAHWRQQELFVYNVEKLDDELYKALQFTVDVYGAEYQEILANSSRFLILLKRVLSFFEDTKQEQPLGTIALRLIEQVYYKPDVLNKAVYEAIHVSMPETEKAEWAGKWEWPDDSRSFVSKLYRYVAAASEDRKKKRAALCQAYHLALHDHFQAGRDLLHLGNMQEHAHESTDVHIQILYNRAIAQMGLCAFRLGKIHEAHNCLMEVCMHNKARELLAQGLSYSKNMADRTADQERAERLRQLPYHMHINLEVLESAHHICAMLLEIPNLAMQAIDPTNKRIISRVLRRSLDLHDKQLFTGPPENAKESVIYAAKALQKGEWQTACEALENLKVWDHIDPGNPTAGVRVTAMIKEKIKIEALRTYLFAYASIYDAFHLDQLVGMFDLPAKTIHSIVSKMMIKEEITAFWDESSNYVLMQHVEPTPLQRLALALADKGAQAVENNEKLVDQKTGGYGIKEARPAQPGRWDLQGGGKGRMGKGSLLDGFKGKGKGRGKHVSGPPRFRGWENARAGAIRGNAQRGWATNKS